MLFFSLILADINVGPVPGVDFLAAGYMMVGLIVMTAEALLQLFVINLLLLLFASIYYLIYL